MLIKLLAALLALLFSKASSLEHEKSFLLQDGATFVYSIAFYRDSLLLTSSNDIIQKDIETGAIQRTFRAHTNQIQSFLVVNDTRMITSAWDDMIILWDLESGSVLKRIWLRALRTSVNCLAFLDNQLFAAGFDFTVRRIDLVGAKVTTVIRYAFSVSSILVDREFLYLGMEGSSTKLQKINAQSSSLVLNFDGHSDSVFDLALSANLLFSGSADRSIICWNPDNGELLRTLVGHTAYVYVLYNLANDLYSGGSDGNIIKWNIPDGQMLKLYPSYHDGTVRCIAARNNVLFSGSEDTVVIKRNISTGSPLFVYRGRQRTLTSVVLWTNFVISGGDDALVRSWDLSFDSLESAFILEGHLNCVNSLIIYDDSLFSGSSDLTVRQWNITDFSCLKIFLGHTSSVMTLAAGNSFLYSSGYDRIIIQWNVLSGIAMKEFIGHSGSVLSLLHSDDNIISGSEDWTMKIWETMNAQNTQTFNVYSPVQCILLLGDRIVSGSVRGFDMIQISTAESIVSLEEFSVAYAIEASDSRIFSGHFQGVINARDLNYLTILDIYQGHQDVVSSICIDLNGVLYSASYDGSIKKWNMAARKVAFSFENREASVTAVAVSRNFLFVGTRSGQINGFQISSAFNIHSFNYHSKSITAFMMAEDGLYSSGLDGRILKIPYDNVNDAIIIYEDQEAPVKSLALTSENLFLIRGELEIALLPRNLSTAFTRKIYSGAPLISIIATENLILSGAKSGVIYGFIAQTGSLKFELKGHTARVNNLLVEEDILFSASDDKTIIQWSLKDANVMKILKRYSLNALGHLGPVNSLSICNNMLFSAGSDNTVRRWSKFTGKHEDVYFGFSKSVSSVVCYNNSIFAGSEDFSVLMFRLQPTGEDTTGKPQFTQMPTKSAGFKRKIIKSPKTPASEDSLPFLQIGIVLVIVFTLISISVLLIRRKVTRELMKKSESPTVSTDYSISVTNLQTVINSVMGISKHAEFLIESSSIAKYKKIASGGGGELFLARIMNSSLAEKFGDTVIQKIVFIKNQTTVEAFYQEVGIMIMLSTFPHFCKIIGYTEKPLSMVLKYYSDGSLFDWLHKNQSGTAINIKILKEVAEALNTMHSHYLAHCDLKSQNVLIEVFQGIPCCYLTDFGITQILSDQIVATRMFNIINLRGLSVNFAAPEVFNSFRDKIYIGADFKKYDMYSFACVTYEVLVKKFPWL